MKKFIIREDNSTNETTSSFANMTDLVSEVTLLLWKHWGLKPESSNWLDELKEHGMSVWYNKRDGYILRRDRKAAGLVFVLI